MANLGILGGGLGDVLDGAPARSSTANPLPAGVTYDFVGQAEDFADLAHNMAIAILLAIVIMYLVLSSLYESFVTPITIMLALPLAMAGAFYALGLVGALSDHGFFAWLHKRHLFHVEQARRQHQPLLHDRPDHAFGPGGQELHPPGGLDHAENPRRHAAAMRRSAWLAWPVCGPS